VGNMITLNKIELLNASRLPARLDMEQIADLLGFQKHDIPVLVKAKLLAPLGNPAPNAPKWFASAIILELSKDEKWLSRATRLISLNWKKKNNMESEPL